MEMEMEIEMQEDPDLDLDLDLAKHTISQFKAEILAKLKQTTEVMKRMADAAVLAGDTEDASQNRRALLADATSGILGLMELLEEAEKMREAQKVMTRDGPSDDEDELMGKIMLLKPALTRMMMGEKPADPEEVWEPQEARELLSQEEMDDAGDEVGTKRGYKDEESQDEAKKRKLD
ncbi:hypothetical protein BJX68DRAFT_265614 [Aspergillus pseudodeflectus]|uniref:Uncharacterized protein n=1 Tax=Aspergillus pseudodeflectus TaxID=176178 RepID=A0ABR4KNC6_9EURO